MNESVLFQICKVTRHRAKTPVDVDSLEKENKDLVRKLRQLEVGPNLMKSYGVTRAAGEKNPWID